MIIFPPNFLERASTDSRFVDAIRFFNKLEKKLEYPQSDGYADQTMFLQRAQEEFLATFYTPEQDSRIDSEYGFNDENVDYGYLKPEFRPLYNYGERVLVSLSGKDNDWHERILDRPIYHEDQAIFTEYPQSSRGYACWNFIKKVSK